MADRPEMFAPTTGFSGMADSMEPCKILWGHNEADPCCHGNEILARRGDPVAYRLVFVFVYERKHAGKQWTQSAMSAYDDTEKTIGDYLLISAPS